MRPAYSWRVVATEDPPPNARRWLGPVETRAEAEDRQNPRFHHVWRGARPISRSVIEVALSSATTPALLLSAQGSDFSTVDLFFLGRGTAPGATEFIKWGAGADDTSGAGGKEFAGCVALGDVRGVTLEAGNEIGD